MMCGQGDTARPGATAPGRTQRVEGISYRVSPKSARMRASVGGCVLKREARPPPEKGLMMNMWAVAGLASSGTRLAIASIFFRASTRPYGLPAICAPDASAAYSRDRRVLGIPSRRERVGRGIRDHEDARHRELRLPRQPFHDVEQPMAGADLLRVVHPEDDLVREPVRPEVHHGGENQRNHEPVGP